MKTTASAFHRRTAGFSRILAAAALAWFSLSTASANPLYALQAYLKADNTSSYAQFGYSVAVSGDTAVVGQGNRNGAYVFVRNGATWTQQALLQSDNAFPGAFGGSVAVSGDTIVVGSTNQGGPPPFGGPGAAHVFVRSGTTWTRQAVLTSAHPGFQTEFGVSVSVSGDTVVVGASNPSDNLPLAGSATVYTRSGSTWTEQANLKASNPGQNDLFGNSVEVVGDTLVVGALGEGSSSTGVNSVPNEDAAFAGAAYVFVRNGTAWSQQAFLKAGNAGAGDYFGRSVALAGDVIVVGADGEDSSTTGVNSAPNESAADAGAGYVFVRSGTTWSQQAYLKAGNAGAGDKFGSSAAVTGDTVVVGAIGEASSTAGVDSTPNDAAAGAGAAYVFSRAAAVWTQQAYLKASNPAAGANFGKAVGAAGDTVIAGANFESSSSTGINSTPNTAAPQAGAAYIFVPPFQFSPWTGDATSGIGSKTIWARRFGVADNATINGVTLAGTGYIVSSPAFDLAGPTTNYTLDDTNNLSGLTGQGSATVAKRFSYGGNPATLTFKQLTPGFTYTATLLTVGWDTTPGIRAQTFTSGTDSRVIDQNAYGDNAGLRIDYTFKAGAPTRTLTITPPNANYTFHLYAVALRLAGFTAPADLRLAKNGANLNFDFTSAAGLSYTLWQSDALQSWTNTGLPAITGDSTAKTMTLPAPNSTVPKRYYRVLAQ